MKRIALPLSIAVVLVYWLRSIGGRLSRPGEGPTWPDVPSLTLFVCVKTVVAVGVIVPLLRANGERVADLGCGPRDLRDALPRGAVLAVSLFVILFVARVLLVSFGVGGRGASPSVVALFRDPREAPLWVFCAVVGGGFTEELVRAFILTRAERAFGRRGLVLALAADCVEFGLAHRYQGTHAVVTFGLMAVLCSLTFLRRRRVADAMVAHAGYDLIAVATAYGLYGRGG